MKKKIELIRDFYDLGESALHTSLTAEDLIQLGAQNEITLWFMPNRSTPKKIRFLPTNKFDDIPTDIREMRIPPVIQERSNDLNYTVINPEPGSQYGAIYFNELIDELPIHFRCLANYLNEPHTAQLWVHYLDIFLRYFSGSNLNSECRIDLLNKLEKISPGITNKGTLIANLKQHTLVKQAIEEKRIAIRRDDLQRILTGQRSSQSSENEPTGTTKTTLLKMVIGMAMARYKYEPNSTKNSAAPAKILQDIQSLGLDLDADTIRNALRIAAEQLPATLGSPGKPGKT